MPRSRMLPASRSSHPHVRLELVPEDRRVAEAFLQQLKLPCCCAALQKPQTTSLRADVCEVQACREQNGTRAICRCQACGDEAVPPAEPASNIMLQSLLCSSCDTCPFCVCPTQPGSAKKARGSLWSGSNSVPTSWSIPQCSAGTGQATLCGAISGS